MAMIRVEDELCVCVLSAGGRPRKWWPPCVRSDVARRTSDVIRLCCTCVVGRRCFDVSLLPKPQQFLRNRSDSTIDEWRGGHREQSSCTWSSMMRQRDYRDLYIISASNLSITPCWLEKRVVVGTRGEAMTTTMTSNERRDQTFRAMWPRIRQESNVEP